MMHYAYTDEPTAAQGIVVTLMPTSSSQDAMLCCPSVTQFVCFQAEV